MKFAKTLPGAFYNLAKERATEPLYFTKKSGAWTPLTGAESLRFVLQTIQGLRRLGFKAGQTATILSENRYEWVLTDYAVQWLGGAVAAIYTTSSPEQIKYILNESEAVVAFVSGDASLDRLSSLSGLTSLKHIVTWDFVAQPKVPAGVQAIHREEFLKEECPDTEALIALQNLDPQSMNILLYTSGTTGEPKGVVLTHENVMSNLEMFQKALPLRSGQATVSFLPLSHIYERVVHSYLLLSGIRVYFAENIGKLIENFSEVRPHINIAVPRIFEKIYAKVMEKIKSSPWVRRRIFFRALWVGTRTTEWRLAQKPLPLLWRLAYGISDVLVFRKIREITGGRARMFISGGAPLSQEIAEFFFHVGFTIYEGYGLSETCILSVNQPGRMKFGTVGRPFNEIELKIAEDGEILARGPTIMRGYFKKPEATAEILESDGWFHTGDIGEFDSDGYLKITDRKKDLIVLAAGKKIAPQPIENALKADPLIEMACLIGDRKHYISALISPNLEFCKGWAHSKGFELSSLEDCVKSDRLRERFQRVVDEVNATLPRYSTIKYFSVLPNSFTIESGELTPTLKLKRRVIQERYSKVIDSMYSISAT